MVRLKTVFGSTTESYLIEFNLDVSMRYNTSDMFVKNPYISVSRNPVYICDYFVVYILWWYSGVKRGRSGEVQNTWRYFLVTIMCSYIGD